MAPGLHLQYRMLDRDLDGEIERNLDEDGTLDDIDGDSTPAAAPTLMGYELDTITAFQFF